MIFVLIAVLYFSQHIIFSSFDDHKKAAFKDVIIIMHIIKGFLFLSLCSLMFIQFFSTLIYFIKIKKELNELDSGLSSLSPSQKRRVCLILSIVILNIIITLVFEFV